MLGILSGDGSGNLNLSSSVTRAQFVTMMVAASSHKDAVGSYGSSLFKDLKGDHWASPYVKVAVEQGWMSGYVDGTFRPDQGITLEEGCTALLRLLGYDSSTLTGAYPTAQLSKASALGLLDDVGAVQGQQLTRQDCVDLFYNALTAQNSAGTIYGTTLGYTVTNGQVDYSALVTADTKGPYVAESGALSLSFTPSSVYYNGALSSLSSVQQYDVYYYNANMRTVWIYHDRVTGTLTGVSPSKSAPTSATVAGVSYDIGTSEATYQLSSQGSFQEGDLVTLLLGMNGEIISVLDAQESEATYYGSVVSSVKGASSSSTSSSSTTSAQVTTQVACTDGVVRTFYHSGSALNTGRLVTVSVTQSGTKVTSLSNKKLEGSVSKDGSSFAGHDFADGVQILDTDENGGYARIYPSRLAGAKLSGDDVRYYSLDANGDIDRLVLHEVTGDTWEYVYVSSVVNNSSDMNISASYTYVQDGQTQTLNSSKLYSVKSGGAAMKRWTACPPCPPWPAIRNMPWQRMFRSCFGTAQNTIRHPCPRSTAKVTGSPAGTTTWAVPPESASALSWLLPADLPLLYTKMAGQDKISGPAGSFLFTSPQHQGNQLTEHHSRLGSGGGASRGQCPVRTSA